MKVKERISFYLYMALGIFLIFTGVRYFFCSTFLPHHEKIIGMNWEALSTGMRVFIHGSMRISGAAFITIGSTAVILALVPLRRGEKWAKITLPAMLFLFGTVLLYVNLYVVSATGTPTPWPASVFCLAMVSAAAVLSGALSGKKVK